MFTKEGVSRQLSTQANLTFHRIRLRRVWVFPDHEAFRSVDISHKADPIFLVVAIAQPSDPTPPHRLDLQTDSVYSSIPLRISSVTKKGLYFLKAKNGLFQTRTRKLFRSLSLGTSNPKEANGLRSSLPDRFHRNKRFLQRNSPSWKPFPYKPHQADAAKNFPGESTSK